MGYFREGRFRSRRSVSGSDNLERSACLESGMNEVEESAIGLNGNDVEGDEDAWIDGGTDDVFVMGIKYAEVVLAPVVGGGGHDLESKRNEPVIGLLLGHGDEFESWLGNADGEIILLHHNSLQPIQFRGDEILETQAFQILIRRCLPKMKASRVLFGGDKGEIDAGCQAEDATSRYFKIPIVLDKDIVFLSATRETVGEVGKI